MFEIDKEKLGAFISQLRKEKGYTQKELAEQLFLSNKAISKWETGASMPDTSLLIPLADLLGVTVTELLTCQRMSPNTSIEASKVEDLVKTTITYTEEEQTQVVQNRRQWAVAYLLSLFLCCLETLLLYSQNRLDSNVLIFLGLSTFMGGYFCIYAKQKLPTYYDQNRICFYSDGMFRMNVPGVSFNNSNWPHILRAIRIWLLFVMVGYPGLSFLADVFLPEQLYIPFSYGLLVMYLIGLFLSIYIPGRKYQ